MTWHQVEMKQEVFLCNIMNSKENVYLLMEVKTL